MDKRALKAAFPLTVPILAGYLVLGAGFGILLSSKGYSFLWAAVMSLTIYGGSAQYVAVDRYKNMGKIKPYLIFGLTDETYSLVCGAGIPEGVEPKKFFFYITVLDQLYWVAGSVIGALAGSAFKFNTEGVDFAMTALFVVIFINQWLNSKNHIPAVIGVASTAVCLVIFGPTNFLIPSMVVISAALMAMRKSLSVKGAESK